MRVLLVRHLVVEAVHLAGGQRAVVVAVGRRRNDILLRALVFVGRVEVRVADDRQQDGCLLRRNARGLHQRGQVVLAAERQDLVLAIVVMDAVAEEDPLGVDQEGVPLLAAALPGIVLQDGFQRMADAEVVLEVLLPDDVAAGLGSLAEVVDILLLLERERLPSGDPVAQHLDVRKLVDGILEIGFGALLCAVIATCQARQAQTCNQCHYEYLFHSATKIQN